MNECTKLAWQVRAHTWANKKKSNNIEWWSIQRQMRHTCKRSINYWINSRSQRQCTLNNNSRANYEQIPCNKSVSMGQEMRVKWWKKGSRHTQNEPFSCGRMKKKKKTTRIIFVDCAVNFSNYRTDWKLCAKHFQNIHNHSMGIRLMNYRCVCGIFTDVKKRC